MNKRLILRAQAQEYFRSVGFAFVQDNELGFTTHVSKPIEMEPYKDVEYINPCAVVSLENCQKLMDDLWNMGLRPSFERIEYAGELKATKTHLQDMRQLADLLIWKKLGNPFLKEK